MATSKEEQKDGKFSEEKAHYESLIKLFDSSFKFIGILFTMTAGIVLFMTFSSIRDLQSALADEKKNLRDASAEAKKEVEDKADKMEKQVADIIARTDEQVRRAESKAIAEIANVKDEATTIARSESKRRIDEVFQARNLESYIESVAKDKLDPKIQQIVDNQLKKVNAVVDRQAAEQILLTDNVRGFGNGGIATGYSISILDSLSRFAISSSVKRKALKHITDLRTDKQQYFPIRQEFNKFEKLTTDSLALFAFKTTANKDVRGLLNKHATLVDLTYKSTRSDDVASFHLPLFFILFNKLTNRNVGYYDYEELDKAYADYKRRNK